MSTRKSDLRRKGMLEGLRHLLERTPYAEIGVRAIAEEAGVTRPAFYFYFATKAEALAALLEDLEQEFVDVAGTWYEHSVDDQVAALVVGMERTVMLWRTNANLMLAMLDAVALDAGARSHWANFQQHFIDRAAARIEMDEGIRLRTAGIDPRSLASVLVGAAFSALEYEARKPASSLDGSLAHSMAFIWCTAIYGEARWSRMDAPSASGD